jgi:hypothetical protein
MIHTYSIIVVDASASERLYCRMRFSGSGTAVWRRSRSRMNPTFRSSKPCLGPLRKRLLHMLVSPSKVSILVHDSLHYISHINTMAKKRRPESKGTKLSLGAFLRLESPAPISALAPPSVRLPAAQIKRKSPSDPVVLAADYKRGNPTPLEVYARQAFQGLCIECQMMFATWGLNDFSKSIDEPKYAHHSFRDLEHCGCPLCRMLLRDLPEHSDEALQELRSPANQLVNAHVNIMEWSYTYMFRIMFRGTSGRQIEANFEMYSAGEPRSTMSSLQLMIEIGRDSPSIKPSSYSSTDCKPVWDIVTKWLQECRELHPDCATTHATRTLPTRLLNIGTSNDELRLVLSKSLPIHTQYATLSHYWGSTPFMKLTRENFDAFLTIVPFKRLSKTFRDAITAARNLGFHYLWVCSSLIIMTQHSFKFRSLALQRNTDFKVMLD